jgi:hypothetical protein
MFYSRGQITAYTQQPTYCLTSQGDFLEVAGEVCHNLEERESRLSQK